MRWASLRGGARAGVAELDPLLAGTDLDDAFDENAGRVDVSGVDLAGRHEMLDLGDGDLRRGGHERIEVPRGLAIEQIAGCIALPGVHDGKVWEPGAPHE